MPPVDPNEPMMTGENSFIRLSLDGGKNLSDRASHWRVLWCPVGAGHTLFLQSTLTDNKVRIYSDNIAVARWLPWRGVPLVVLASPYRSLLRPLLEYIDKIHARSDDQMVTVVLPEFLPRRWWQHVLHNQTALLVKGALLFRTNTVVADVPYLLKR